MTDTSFEIAIVALKEIAQMRGMTLIKPSMGSLYDAGHQEGANKAFGQTADLANAALAIALSRAEGL